MRITVTIPDEQVELFCKRRKWSENEGDPKAAVNYAQEKDRILRARQKGETDEEVQEYVPATKKEFIENEILEFFALESYAQIQEDEGNERAREEAEKAEYAVLLHTPVTRAKE